MSQVELFGFAPSTFVRSARMACHLAGVSYELSPLAFKQASHFGLHPFGKMPVMKHGELTLFETLAIVAYIDDVFHKSQLQPREAVPRARMWQWASAAISELYTPLVSNLISDAPDEAAVAAAGAGLTLLDRQLEQGAGLAGDKPTLADLLCFPMIDFALRKLGAEKAPGLAHVRAYHAHWNRTPAAEATRA